MDIQLSFLELRQKEVINVLSGKRLGHIIDIVFNAYGKISGIVLPAPRKFFWWKTCEDIIVKWCDIDKIGADVILIKPGMHKEEKFDQNGCKRKNEDCRVKTVPNEDCGFEPKLRLVDDKEYCEDNLYDNRRDYYDVPTEGRYAK